MPSTLERLACVWGLYLSRLSDLPLVRPRSVTLTLTSRCNLRCVMCNHWRNPTRPADEMSFEQAAALIDEVAAWGVQEVELAGGEPMVRRDFLALLNRAAQRGVGVNIVTNGTLIDETVSRQLAETPRLRLQISIDAHTARLHDLIRGRKGSFEKAMRGAELVRRCSADKLPLNATTVVLSKNAACLLKVAAALRDRGFASITFQPIVDDNLNILARWEHNPLRPSGKSLERLERSIDQLIEFKSSKGFVANSPENLRMIARYYRNGLNRTEVQCYSGYVVAIVAPDGQLWSCMGNAGSVYPRGLRERWHSMEARSLRRKIRGCERPCLYPCFLDCEASSPLAATRKILVHAILSDETALGR